MRAQSGSEAVSVVTAAIGPVLFTLFVWWFSTGLILFLDRLPRTTFRWSMGIATLIAAAGLIGLAGARNDTSVAGAYCAFASAILVWAWHECSFLLGFLTGPSDKPCPPGCAGWRRLKLAATSIIHHELALAATGLVVIALAAGGANKVGLWTFVVLWTMRLSTKINLFLGVPNVGEEFLPEHLRYIASYFAKRPMNLFFPVSVTLTTGALGFVLRDLTTPGLSDFDTAALCFLVTLLALAVIEHWFLVSPIPVTGLWSWSLKERGSALLAPVDQARIVESPARVTRLANQPHSVGRSP
jgi:putative photosynthetic complex assembly protein 2